MALVARARALLTGARLMLWMWREQRKANRELDAALRAAFLREYGRLPTRKELRLERALIRENLK